MTIIGVSTKMPLYCNKSWKLMVTATGGSAYIWSSKEKNDSILLKGTVTSTTSARGVFNWLLDHHLGTGLEDVMTSSELLHLNVDKRVVVRRLVCKSDRLMFSSRSFVVVTSWMALDDGSYCIVTRSLPKGIKALAEKKMVRGNIFSCGYYIRPVAQIGDGKQKNCIPFHS